MITRTLLSFLLIACCHFVAAQTNTSAELVVQTFLKNHTVAISPGEAEGNYTATGFMYSQKLNLQQDGTFTLSGKSDLAEEESRRGTWEVHGHTLYLRHPDGTTEMAYLIRHNGTIALLTSSQIAQWKFWLEEGSYTPEPKLVFERG